MSDALNAWEIQSSSKPPDYLFPLSAPMTSTTRSSVRQRPVVRSLQTFCERTEYGQLFYLLAMLHIFSVETAAACFKCGRNDESVVEAELITRPYVQRCPIEANTGLNPE